MQGRRVRGAVVLDVKLLRNSLGEKWVLNFESAPKSHESADCLGIRAMSSSIGCHSDCPATLSAEHWIPLKTEREL